MNLKHFEATAVDGKNLAIYDSSLVERDMSLGAIKIRWFVGILKDTREADTLLIQREQKLNKVCGLRDATDANMEVNEEDLGLLCWFFNKPYNNMCLMRGGTQLRRVLEIEILHRTAGRNPTFLG